MKTQCRIIMACTLLHNLILQKMPIDPLDIDVPLMRETLEDMGGELDQSEFITSMSTLNEWTNFWNGLAESM
uniref:DDE Tnp4 domain-containing protein n=1 Tax=Hordeum vulgare subsp. vulgare TaxID=112509 RepID=A0A8I6YTL0_HORVV